MNGTLGSTTEAPFIIEPLTANCRVVCARGAHCVVGVSPNNSYFSVPRLTALLGWLSGRFDRVDVVLPDSALVHTHLALGHEHAEKRARAEITVLRNRVLRAWDGADVHLMSELATRPAYQRLSAQVKQAMATDFRLRATCREMSHQVLMGRLCGAAPTALQLDRAAGYLAAELPFFLDSAAIFDTPSSLSFYHRPVPLAELVFTGRTSLRPSPRQGYALIRPTDEGGQ